MSPKLKFGRNGAIYAFTTENLSGYLPSLPLTGKSVLSVCGSGDHAINSFLHGAKSVTVFDINPRAFSWSELKRAGLQRLDRLSFQRYFMLNDDDVSFDKKTYETLRDFLPSIAQRFWDQCYQEFDGYGAKLRRSGIFNTLHDRPEIKVLYNDYLHSDHEYLAARQASANGIYQTIECQLPNLVDAVSGQIFDVILLSNLSDYVEMIFGGTGDALYAFAKFLEKLQDVLSPGGCLCASYIYAVDQAGKPHGPVDDPALRQKYFQKIAGLRYEELNIAGAIVNTRDVVVRLFKE